MRTVRFDQSIAAWRKSSYCATNEGCIEIAEQFPDALPVRDSKDTDRPPIIVPRAAWSAFVTTVAATDGKLSRRDL
ncbi:DUF397 domain-containing protein [Streptomyces sp. I05A-00742]|uniref:DUF397 domain-containing protein n=1 Tax=Streptomyces sp. I05A-00742 TaxID=2732853 RepID=UPI001489C0A7|nr:DUF397 domain-containing protein [Streptomyces sp. I05A-00742]